MRIHNNIVFIPSLMGDWLVELRGIELEYLLAENGQQLDRCTYGSTISSQLILFYNKILPYPMVDQMEKALAFMGIIEG